MTMVTGAEDLMGVVWTCRGCGLKDTVLVYDICLLNQLTHEEKMLWN